MCLFVIKITRTSILPIELFIANTLIIHRWFKWCNGNEMIESSKRTVVLTCIKIRLKTLHNCKYLVMYFESVLIKNVIWKSQEILEICQEKSGRFFQLDLWQPCRGSTANFCQ